MKDLLNFEILPRPNGQRVTYRMRHKQRDGLVVEFTTDLNVRAQDVPALIAGVFKSWLHKHRSLTRGGMSARQRKFYDALVWFFKTEGRSPSYEEMAELLGAKSKGTPHYYVQKLVDLGWVWKDEKGRIVPCDVALPEGME